MRTICLALAAVFFTSLGGCVRTGDFWDHPVVLASDRTPSAMDGQWEGSWQSREFYDNGLIHMVIVPETEATAAPATLPDAKNPPLPGTSRYLAHVTLWHYAIFCPEEFNMVLVARPSENGQVQFYAERDLGPLDGFCKYDGFVDRHKATIAYVTRVDFGSVVLRRVVNQ